MSLKQAAKRNLLRVAPPRACNMQQTAPKTQQANATPMQQPPVKPSNGGGLACNSGRNNHATRHRKTVQQTPLKNTPFVAHILRVKLSGYPAFTAIDCTADSLPEAIKKQREKWGDRLLSVTPGGRNQP